MAPMADGGRAKAVYSGLTWGRVRQIDSSGQLYIAGTRWNVLYLGVGRGGIGGRVCHASIIAGTGRGSHRITFHFTPKHASWLNQIEIWFSILARKILRRGNFISKQDLKDKIEAFIKFFNETLAKPFRWTYTGKPLAA